jgi:hypothetical protein
MWELAGLTFRKSAVSSASGPTLHSGLSVDQHRHRLIAGLKKL